MDKLLFKDWQNMLVADIAYKLRQLYKMPLVITISGVSGTAKTEVGVLLQELLEKENSNYKLLHIDDFYNTKPHYRQATRKRTGVIGESEIASDCLYGVATDYLLAGCWDGIIVEGIYAYLCYGFANTYNIRIDATEKQTKEFRVERGKEKQTKFRNKVLRQERSALKKAVTPFDLIVNLSDYVEYVGE